jgi:hypothetical protein
MDAIAPIKAGETPHRRGRGANRSIKVLQVRERGRCVKRALERQAVDTRLAAEIAR